eukprot:1182932-Prorocentrum_minimum.AAC.3
MRGDVFVRLPWGRVGVSGSGCGERAGDRINNKLSVLRTVCRGDDGCGGEKQYMTVGGDDVQGGAPPGQRLGPYRPCSHVQRYYGCTV